jgi:murein DD-endopeptidase MepM/ murein hydrolase activator NlpD
MDLNATRSRRQMIGSLAGLVGGVAVGGRLLLDGVTFADGHVAEIRRPATALETAVRQIPVAELHFPVDVTGGDLVMPNGFGGVSGVGGSHRGVDIGNECTDGTGRPLLACVDGELVSEKVLSSAGRLRILRDAAGDHYRYHHLDSYEDTIVVGDRVERGQVIGYMGSSGNTVWAHLHFEVWVGGLSPQTGGAAVDPEPLLPLPMPGVRVGPPSCS